MTETLAWNPVEFSADDAIVRIKEFQRAVLDGIVTHRSISVRLMQSGTAYSNFAEDLAEANRQVVLFGHDRYVAELMQSHTMPIRERGTSRTPKTKRNFW